MSKLAKLATTFGISALLISPTPVYAADLESGIPGEVHAFSYSTNHSVAVRDDSCTGHTLRAGVVAHYHRQTTKDMELRNNNGCDTTAWSGSSSANKVVGVLGCVVYDFWPDDCGSWDGQIT